MLAVLFATSEAYPLVKTGGLGDISYALPRALCQAGVDVRLLLPGYPAVLKTLSLKIIHDNIKLLPHLPTMRLLEGQMLGDTKLPVYVLDCPQLFMRDGGIYQDQHGHDWHDNAQRFAALSKLAALFASHCFDFKPQIIHCNDWQTGLTPAYLAQMPHFAKTVISIHNMAYQGVFPAHLLAELDLPPHSYHMHGVEYYGALSFLKAGLAYANAISTVSPTYAREIQHPDFGYGLAGLLASRREQLTGIINGVDTDEWNPETDTHLFKNYSFKTLADKTENKRVLCEKLGLSYHPKQPLIGMITRLTYQKGVDLVLSILPEILNEGAQLVLLGSGDKALEMQLQHFAAQLPQKVSVTFGYNEALAHQIEAAVDIFLMPSRFEPCGLNQMYSMHYGTLPIVRKTGGLADSVVDTTPAHLEQGIATGFVFEKDEELLRCVQRALLVYRNPEMWQTVQQHAMAYDVSWSNSAQQYIQLYQRLL